MNNNINTISDPDGKRDSIAWHIVLIIEVAPKNGLYSFRTKMKANAHFGTIGSVVRISILITQKENPRYQSLVKIPKGKF